MIRLMDMIYKVGEPDFSKLRKNLSQMQFKLPTLENVLADRCSFTRHPSGYICKRKIIARLFKVLYRQVLDQNKHFAKDFTSIYPFFIDNISN